MTIAESPARARGMLWSEGAAWRWQARAAALAFRPRRRWQLPGADSEVIAPIIPRWSRPPFRF